MTTKRERIEMPRVADRPHREIKKIRPLLTERAFRNGTVELTMDEQCGMDQPKPGQHVKRSPTEEKGDDIWMDYLKPNGWKYKYDERHGCVFHHPGVKATSGQEGVTMFSGYDAITEQFEKDGKDETKMLQRARDAVSTPAAAAASQETPATLAQGTPPASTAVPVSTVEASFVTPPATTTGTLLVDLTNTTKRKSLVVRVGDLEAAVAGTEGHGPLMQRVEQLEKEMIGSTVAVEATLMQRVKRLERELEL